MLISLVHLAQQTSINYFYLVYPRSKFRCTCTCHGESDPLLPSQPMKQTVEVVTIIPWSTCTCMSGHEIAPNTVANATKIIVLATKIQKVSRQVGDQNSLGFVYLTLMFFATK